MPRDARARTRAPTSHKTLGRSFLRHIFDIQQNQLLAGLGFGAAGVEHHPSPTQVGEIVANFEILHSPVVGFTHLAFHSADIPLIRLLHLPPAPRPKDRQVAVLEKAYLMQVRLDLEAKVEAESRKG
ncbi:hypothetical protein SBA7_1650014 [Candidatus Sulfotelmatobacter sp. SbA7]|nr:hypothetical protein SBA7_1650014 [Candidatus Sulfotelmatobacter sp. SbA7]